MGNEGRKTPMDSADNTELAARRVLDILKGRQLRIERLMNAFIQPPWDDAAFNAGMTLAQQRGWINLGDGGAYHLTDLGVAASQQQYLSETDET